MKITNYKRSQIRGKRITLKRWRPVYKLIRIDGKMYLELIEYNSGLEREKPNKPQFVGAHGLVDNIKDAITYTKAPVFNF